MRPASAFALGFRLRFSGARRASVTGRQPLPKRRR